MSLPLDDLEPFRLRGDAEAAAALEDVLSRLTPDEAAKLLQTLGRWDPSKSPNSLPPPVRDYVLQPFERLPGWVDEARILDAQQAYSDRHALRARIVLAAFSLPVLYIHPEIALSLAGTGQLLLHVRRRLKDTQAYIDAVMTPGSLRPGGAGQRWIRKVRLTHALMRKRLLDENGHAAAGEGWHGCQAVYDACTRGLQVRIDAAVDDPMPLDQVEQAFVLQTFGWAIVDGLRKMGWGMSRAEAADHVHVWSAIGHMMGIDEALLPRGKTALADARRLFERVRDAQLARGDPLGPVADDQRDTWLAGRLLTGAWLTILVQIQRERTPERMRMWLVRLPWLDEALQQLPRVLIRRLCGVRAARHLRISRVPLLHWLVCRLALLLVDVRKLAADERTPSAGELSGAAR